MRQFRADNKTEVYFDYRKLYQSTNGAHLIDINDTIKFWIPRAWITKFNRKKKRIHVKGYWADEISLKLKGIVN